MDTLEERLAPPCFDGDYLLGAESPRVLSADTPEQRERNLQTVEAWYRAQSRDRAVEVEGAKEKPLAMLKAHEDNHRPVGLSQEVSVTIRMIERLDRPLHIDEVREELPTIGWTLVGEHEDYFIESNRLPGVQSGIYHVLVAEAENRVAFAGFFNDYGELQMQEYRHVRLDVSLPMPNAQHGVFSVEWATEVLARMAEGAVGPSDNWASSDDMEDGE